MKRLTIWFVLLTLTLTLLIVPTVAGTFAYGKTTNIQEPLNRPQGGNAEFTPGDGAGPPNVGNEVPDIPDIPDPIPPETIWPGFGDGGGPIGGGPIDDWDEGIPIP